MRPTPTTRPLPSLRIRRRLHTANALFVYMTNAPVFTMTALTMARQKCDSVGTQLQAARLRESPQRALKRNLVQGIGSAVRRETIISPCYAETVEW
ncbi:hypothetical protein BDV09DRAFT_32966 [Aspergillus tetrazonus]